MGVNSYAPSMNRTVINTVYVSGLTAKYFDPAAYKITKVDENKKAFPCFKAENLNEE